MTPDEQKEFDRRCRLAGRRIIEEQTRRQVRTFLDELRNGTRNYRTVASLQGQVAQEYRGRAIMELLQNAHDVLADVDRDDPRRISFVLRCSSEPELLVANSGRPFRHEDFSGICQLAQSPKDPNESVGNKGLGFQSVLELSTCPEVWSMVPAGSDTSFAFGFDRGVCDPIADVAEALAKNELSINPAFGSEQVVEWSKKQMSEYRKSVVAGGFVLREEVTNYLSPYVFPRPLGEPPDHVAELLTDGHVTVIRLPLDGGATGSRGEAVESVRKQLDSLDEAAMIFLQHLRSLRIIIEGDGVELTRRVDSSQSCSGSGIRKERLRVSRSGPEASGSTQRAFRTWSRAVGGGGDPEHAEQIEAAVRHLPNRWPEIRQVEVGVAVEETAEAREGVYVIFLPTEVRTARGAHINAPFHGSLNRLKINFDDPYNKLLLDFVADLVLDTTVDLLEGDAEVWRGRAVIDLIAVVGDPPGAAEALTNRLLEQALERDAPLDQMALILCDVGGREPGDSGDIPAVLNDDPIGPAEWRLPGLARAMPAVSDDDPVGASEWRRAAGFTVVSRALDERCNPVKALLRSLGGSPAPLPEEWAATLERLAERIGPRGPERAGNSDPGAGNVAIGWDSFLRSVLAMLPGDIRAEPRPSDPDSLADTRFLPAEDGRLLAATDEARLFFRPRRGADDAADFAGSVPESLQHVVAFLHEGVKTHEGQRRRNTPVQKFLDGRFVHRFRRVELLERLIIQSLPELPATHGSDAAARCADALAWTLEIVGSDENERLRPLLGQLPVACTDGWLPMEDAVFGPQWEGRQGEHLQTLADALPDAANRILGHALLPPGDDRWRTDVSDRADLFAWAGVAEGIRLTPCDPIPFEMSRAHPRLPDAAPSSVPQSAWDDWRRAAIDEVQPYHKSHFKYELRGVCTVSELHREDLADSARYALSELVLASLKHWADGWEDATIRKTTSWHWSQPVTSPLKHWLTTQPWLVGGPPADTGKPLSQRWFVPEYLLRGKPGHFRHLSPLPLSLARRLALDADLLRALTTLGLNVYPTEDARTGPALLEALAEAMERNFMPVGGFDVLLGQVRRAWKHLDPDRSLPTRFIVRTRPRTATTRPEEALSDVYLPDDEANTRSLREHEQPIMAILQNEARGSVGERLEALGARRASGLTEDCMVDGRRVVDRAGRDRTLDRPDRDRTPSEADGTITLDEAGLRWLPLVLLALHAHGGANPGGHATKAWRQAARRLRRVRVRQCRTIRMELSDGDRIVARSEPTAHWLSRSGLLLLREEIVRRGRYEEMAGPAQAIVDRRDLLKDLRLVLGSLSGMRAPNRRQIEAALERAEIDAVAVADIRLGWLGTAALVDRIRPVLRILGISDDGLDMSSIDIARLTALLESKVGQPHAEALLTAARECYDDFEMGFDVKRILREAPDLPKWNAALSELGGEYVPVRNEAARYQARRHLSEMSRPLRAFARHVATRDASVPVDDQAELFAEVRAAHERLHVDDVWNRRCEEWTHLWWRVPFVEVLGLVRSRYAEIAKCEPHLRALDGVSTIGKLKKALQTHGVALVEDPLDIARENQYRLNRIVSRVWELYRAWSRREKADSESTATAPEFGLEERMFLRALSESELGNLAKTKINNAGFREATAHCGTVEEMREELGITEEELKPVRGQDEATKREEERQRRVFVIAGRPFEVGGAETYRDLYQRLEELPEPPDGPGVRDLD